MADLINCAGGVDGTPVEMVVQDIQGEPEVTQRAAQDLLDAGAHAIIGPPFAAHGTPDEVRADPLVREACLGAAADDPEGAARDRPELRPDRGSA